MIGALINSASPVTGVQMFYDLLPSTLIFNDGNFHTLASVTFSVNGTQKVKVTWSADFKAATAARGIHANIREGTTFIYPPDGSSGNDWINTQTSETQLWSATYVFVPSAGQHTWNFDVNAAIGITTITIPFAVLVIEIYT